MAALPESFFDPLTCPDGICDGCSVWHVPVTLATTGWFCDSCLRMGLKTGVIL